MEESARYLMFHAVIVLLAGLLAGIPYGRAILKNTNERLIGAWRVAHAALPMGAILLLVLSVSFSGLNVAINLKWAISILFIISGYGFMVALLLGPVVGYRGLSSRGPIAAKLVYSGNLLGAITSLFGTVALLYAAWLNL
jgi:hypothetical protein